jgi:hypothetical protein
VNAFDKCHGLNSKESIGNLLEKDDIRDFVNILLKFVLQVCKMDGSLYPSNS